MYPVQVAEQPPGGPRVGGGGVTGMQAGGALAGLGISVRCGQMIMNQF